VYRILGILGSFLACSALIVWAVVGTVGPAARGRGANLYVYRQYFNRILGAPTPAERPLVVWLGDSTIMGAKRPSYPHVLKPLLRQGGVDTLVIAGAGFDAYVHYFLIGRVLELDPALVVIVAHLASFHPKGGGAFTYNDTSSYLRPSQLPRTFLLPLAERHLSPARLLLAQTLNFETAEETLYTMEGVRVLYDEAPFWTSLGPPKPPAVFNAAYPEVLRSYDIRLSRRQPTVRVLEAAVRAVTTAGHVALVIATPVPYQAMQQRRWYDAAAMQRRVDVLRAATEDAGGRFADLHRALPQAEFADYGGHFGAAGAQHIADLVLPFVREGLARAAAAPAAEPRAAAGAP
jgi:hypothetical protein